jgi:hypothetical protein
MEKSINTRIKEVREHYCHDSNKEFATVLSESGATVNNWIRDGYSVGRGVASKIVTKFPEVDLNWLLTGNGEMLKANNIGHTTAGDNSPISGNINVNECRNELEKAKMEISYLKEIVKEKDMQMEELKTLFEKRLKDKEEIIELLKNK